MVGAKTLVFDVHQQFLFRNEQGQLADLDELMNRPQLIRKASQGLVIREAPYEEYLLRLQDREISFSRMEHQKLWPRFGHEVLRWFGLRS